MDDIIVSIENLLCEFQVKFKEIEEIVYHTNKQFNRLKVEYVKSVPIAKGSVMSMKDFVSYMSTLEDYENEDTSQNISELPNDNEEIVPTESDKTLLNQRPIEQNTKTSKRKSSRRGSTFIKHNVIHEEVDEADDTVGSEFEQASFSLTNSIETSKNIQSTVTKHASNQIQQTEPKQLPFNQNIPSRLSNKKPTNLDIVKVRIKPDLKTLPFKQHPEPAILASPAPSPMTPTDDKVPKLENEKNRLDKINNNQTIPESKPANRAAKDQQQNKLHCKEGKLPIPKNPKTVILSPTPSPRNPKIPTASGIPTPTPRNLTKTICTQPNAEIAKCRKCGRIRCVQTTHKHNSRSKVKTVPEEWKSAND